MEVEVKDYNIGPTWRKFGTNLWGLPFAGPDVLGILNKCLCTGKDFAH